jgi:hypothetical protein
MEYPMNCIKPITMAVCLALVSQTSMAQMVNPNPEQERQSLEVLRNTTRNLIDALVDAGVLTRDKANQLIREAEQKASVQLATAKPASPVAGSAPVRVQYVPETLKNEIKEQIRQEVLAQAQEEHWANPNVVPGWIDKLAIHGDVLVRDQFDNYAGSNNHPEDYVDGASNVYMTRNAALANNGRTSGNTTYDQNRMRFRGRLDFDIKASADSSAEVRLVSGGSSARNTEMQTLGDGFNKYSLWIDRAAIDYRPRAYFDIKAGKMGNPWVSSDLVWDDNVNFDGVSVSLKPALEEGFVPFMTAGYFPLSPSNMPTIANGKTLYGAQVGASSDLSAVTRARFAIGYYDFHNIEGRQESDECYSTSLATSTCNSYGNTEYPSGWRAQGNTLVRINAPSDSSTTSIWGLASKFRPLHLNFQVDSAPFDPIHVVVSADYVKNTAFDRAEIARRTGADLSDGKSSGYQLKLLLGTPLIKRQDEWNTSMAFRSLGSDAVPDAWADSSLGLGGTNVRGFILGGAYGVRDNTILSLRYLSGRSIDSPLTANYDSTAKFRVDTWQLDMNVRF